jgi:hypothetical protein
MRRPGLFADLSWNKLFPGEPANPFDEGSAPGICSGIYTMLNMYMLVSQQENLHDPALGG